MGEWQTRQMIFGGLAPAMAHRDIDRKSKAWLLAMPALRLNARPMPYAPNMDGEIANARAQAPDGGMGFRA